jgi:CheY-like chemotaxis protein
MREPADSSAISGSPTIERQERALVVVADDDSDMRSLIATSLRRESLPVVEAVDGEALLTTIRRLASSKRRFMRLVVVSDIHMPGRNGLDILRELRTLLPGARTLMITGSDNGPIRSLAMALGAVAVLDKPLDLPLLKRLVLNLAQV